jgi:hypothetical protein
MPPVVEKPSRIILLKQSYFMVWKLLPIPYPALVLKGIAVLPFRSYWLRELFIGGGIGPPPRLHTPGREAYEYSPVFFKAVYFRF